MEINGNSQMAIAKRLSEYIEYDAITTPSQFAANAGIDASGFHKMLKGQLKITNTTLKKISGTYGISMTWLLTGEGETMAPKTPGTVVGMLIGDDAKVSGRDMTINPTAEKFAAEIAAQRALIEKRDAQIDTLLRLLDEKDKQINRLLEIIAQK